MKRTGCKCDTLLLPEIHVSQVTPGHWSIMTMKCILYIILYFEIWLWNTVDTKTGVNQIKVKFDDQFYKCPQLVSFEGVLQITCYVFLQTNWVTECNSVTKSLAFKVHVAGQVWQDRPPITSSCLPCYFPKLLPSVPPWNQNRPGTCSCWTCWEQTFDILKPFCLFTPHTHTREHLWVIHAWPDR